MVQKTVLENGIRVVTETMPHVRSTAIGILVNTSPRCDPPEREGLAHLVEHLMFQGTSSRSARQIAHLMDVGGGHMGGFTTRDYTCYFATVLDDYVPYALDLWGDILLNSVLPPESVEREKTAVLHEIDAGNDSPYERSHTLLKQTVWPHHPLGKPVAGSKHSVQSITREDAIYFLHENYTPDRIVVTAAGNINHEDFTAQVRDALWRMLGESKPVDDAVPVFETAVTLEHLPVSQAYFSLGLPVYKYNHPDRYNLHVLNNLLGGGISSRLYMRLREEHGLVYNIGSEYHAYYDAGVLVIEGSTSPEYLIPVLGLTLVELAKLFTASEPVDAEELWKSKMQIRGQHLIGSEDTNTRMSRLTTQELYFGQHIPAPEILSCIEQVDGDSLQRTTQACQSALSSLSAAIVGPDIPEQYTQDSITALIAEFR